MKNVFAILVLTFSVANAEDAATPIVFTPAKVAMALGDGIKLKPGGSLKGTTNASWTSSDPAVVEVLKNGWIIALKTGSATVRVSDGAGSQECPILVTNAAVKVREPKSIKEFPDERSFELDGRLCYGSELCGHVLGVPRKGYLNSNRVINPTPLNAKRNILWEVAPGAEVLDGAGKLLGTVAPIVYKDGKKVPASAFNFGMSKVMNGRLYLYGFTTPVLASEGLRKEVEADELRDGVIHISAWVPLDSIIDKETLVDRFGVGRGKLPALPLEAQRYRVTGGDPKSYVIPEGELAIVKTANGPVPSHYLRRPCATINLLYSVPGFGLGGQGLDSFLLSDNLTFRPARGVRTFVQPTYYPLKHAKAKEVAPKTMTFLYGAVEAPGCEPLFCWVAKESLEPMK